MGKKSRSSKKRDLSEESIEEEVHVNEEPSEEEPSDAVEEPSDENQDEEKPKRTKTDFNNIWILDSMDRVIADLAEEIENRKRKKKDGTRFLQSKHKKLLEIRKHLPKNLKKKRAPSSGGNRTNSFAIQKPISKEMAQFLGIKDKKPVLSQNEMRTALYVYIYLDPEERREEYLRWQSLNKKGRDLRDPTNKSKIIPDNKLSEVLHYKDYVKQVKKGKIIGTRKNKSTDEKEEYVVEDSTLKRTTILKLMQQHFIK